MYRTPTHSPPASRTRNSHPKPGSEGFVVLGLSHLSLFVDSGTRIEHTDDEHVCLLTYPPVFLVCFSFSLPVFLELYVYVHIYTCLGMYKQIPYTNIYIYIYTQTYAYTDPIYKYACMYIETYQLIYAFICTYIPTYACICMCIYIYTGVCVCACLCTSLCPVLGAGYWPSLASCAHGLGPARLGDFSSGGSRILGTNPDPQMYLY